jgi:hypothetical protein
MMKPLGQGFRIIDCDGVDINTPENQKILNEIVSNAKKIRGEIISNSLDIDFILNDLIGLFFFNTKEKIDIFNECFLYKEFFTFGEKVKLFNFLLKKYPERFHLNSESKRKEIITQITKVMEVRNKFAHEDITVNFKEKVAYIFDKNQQNLLSSQSIGDFQKRICYLTHIYLEFSVNLVIEISKEQT